VSYQVGGGSWRVVGRVRGGVGVVGWRGCGYGGMGGFWGWRWRVFWEGGLGCDAGGGGVGDGNRWGSERWEWEELSVQRRGGSEMGM